MNAKKDQKLTDNGNHVHAPMWKRFTLQTKEEMSVFLDALLAELIQATENERDVFAVRLAMEEAVTNALEHGTRGSPQKSVRVCYSLDHTCFLTKVEDDGAGFSPLAAPDPTLPENIERERGRGLLLMRHYMTSVRFNKSGNRVTMCKCWSTEPQSPTVTPD